LANAIYYGNITLRNQRLAVSCCWFMKLNCDSFLSCSIKTNVRTVCGLPSVLGLESTDGNGGDIRKSQPCWCPAFHQESWALFPEPVPSDLQKPLENISRKTPEYDKNSLDLRRYRSSTASGFLGRRQGHRASWPPFQLPMKQERGW
jgi:hypothetical protein